MVNKHFETGTKWPNFRRWHFKHIFVNDNPCILVQISFKLVPMGPWTTSHQQWPGSLGLNALTILFRRMMFWHPVYSKLFDTMYNLICIDAFIAICTNIHRWQVLYRRLISISRYEMNNLDVPFVLPFHGIHELRIGCSEWSIIPGNRHDLFSSTIIIRSKWLESDKNE